MRRPQAKQPVSWMALAPERALSDEPSECTQRRSRHFGSKQLFQTISTKAHREAHDDHVLSQRQRPAPAWAWAGSTLGGRQDVLPVRMPPAGVPQASCRRPPCAGSTGRGGHMAVLESEE